MCDLTFVPPTPAPPPKTIIVDISPWFVLGFVQQADVHGGDFWGLAC